MVKRGYNYAVNQTIEIAKYLPNKENKDLYKKVVRSIFNDMLIQHTNLPRKERRKLVADLNDELRKLLK